jgi:hypothetical protein
MRAVGVKVEYGEVPVSAIDRRGYKTIDDGEHAEIMALYLGSKQSMGKIGKLKMRSPATIKNQIDEHCAAITRSKFCPKCQRVRGSHTKDSTRAEVITA